ncbi:MAG TPA: FAD-binding oxidoreductase, partial [Stellaceae bacterium]|nr:FAD-binding oxidoreductase [Stellaceae bacterium]
MAGASAGYFLAEHGRVVLLEREEAPGYHSTGRSAALYTETYGNAAIRALTVSSGSFLRDPPKGFTDHPLLTPRGSMVVAPASEEKNYRAALAEGQRYVKSVRGLSVDEAMALCPALRREKVGYAFLEPDAMDMDVHAIHQGFLRGLRARGGEIVSSAEVTALARRGALWEASTPAGRWEAPLVIDAAGAWADKVARLAGVREVGLVPKRRTAFTIDPPAAYDTTGWPMVSDIEETLYFKPESGRLLVSPADQTPIEPCDVQPEEIDVAEAADRLQAKTHIEVRRVLRRWAGLRSFVRDKTPVVGPAPDAPGFFWLAGQGGYGIMTSPAMGRLTAALATGAPVPAELTRLGLAAAHILPNRLLA